MLKETNLDGVKSIARMLLMTPVHKTPYSPAVVQHPFTSCGIAVARKDGWVQTIDITANEKQAENRNFRLFLKFSKFFQFFFEKRVSFS